MEKSWSLALQVSSGEPATLKAVNGYDTMYIVAAAIEKAGSADREAVKTALENDNHDAAVGEIRKL